MKKDTVVELCQPAQGQELLSTMLPEGAQRLVAFEQFVAAFEAKYPKAVECLAKDREVLLAFYDFPAEHWIHIRTTNPIESTFANIRHRTNRTKGCLTRDGIEVRQRVRMADHQSPCRIAA